MLQSRMLRIIEIREKEEQNKNKNKKPGNVQQTMQQTQNQEEKAAEQQEQQEKEDLLFKQIEDETNQQKKEQLQFENPYLNSSIQFNDEISEVDYTEEDRKDLEQNIIDLKGCWLTFTRELAGSSDDIAKLKKNKPKGFNNTDFNPLKCKAWIDLSSLANPGNTTIRQRVYFKQQIDLDSTLYDFNKTYIYIKISLAQPLF